MMARVYSFGLVGLEAKVIEIEVDITPGLPAFNILGLHTAAVREARERIRVAIRNSGLVFPSQHITVNLAPAHLRKNGTAYDLPIALGMLLVSGQLEADLSRVVSLGELTLGGLLCYTTGITAMVDTARELGFTTAFVPRPNRWEAALVGGIEVVAADSLASLVAHLRRVKPLTPLVPAIWEPPQSLEIDLAHIKGQEGAKRALEVAAAGGHSLVMSGPPGWGKTTLARALSSILPSLSLEEAIEVAKVHNIWGLGPTSTPLFYLRPFRTPHSSISEAGLLGGGRNPSPGEVSLAHRGVLFLDDIPRFGHLLLGLLQPLDHKIVTIGRAQGTFSFPANFMLVASMNPCPCGYFGDTVKPCTCPPSVISQYQRRIPGPLLDRIDMFVPVPRMEYDKLFEDRPAETSERVRRRVEEARKVQAARFQGRKTLMNGEMSPSEVREFCQLKLEAEDLLRAAMKLHGLSARTLYLMLKLARTIADLAGAGTIASSHLAEALQYRFRDHGPIRF